ncbi:SLC13 family permease [Prauserella flavalba]|uniref:SLC13 family permease n=1 Tax=Prauserella flavalba TaxID=1477506 RepID=UPI0036E073CC
MSIDLLAVLVLLAIFAIGTFSSVNLGVLGLVASFAVGTLVLGESASDVLSGFPADLFILLFGITYLFSIATVNGTMNWIVSSLAKFVVRGRPAVVPWLGFLVAAIATSAGAAGPAVAGLVSAMGMSLAAMFGIRPLLVAVMVITGTLAGYFSPIGPIGVVSNEALRNVGIPASPVTAFLAVFAFNTVLAAVVYILFGGRSLIGVRKPVRVAARAAAPVGGPISAGTPENDQPDLGDADPSSPGPADDGASAGRLNRAQGCTLAAIAAVAVGALGFNLDIGFISVLAAALLHLLFPRKDAMQHVSWPVILLICGVVTYIATLERAGTITRIGEGLSQVGSQFVAALLLCAAASFLSAFASSIATITAIIPLATPLLFSGEVSALGVFIAILISASLVDASPLTSTGALVVANTHEGDQRRVYRGLLAWGLSMIVVAPILACVVFVLPSLL